MKSYTDLNQSRKLAKILPIESADMCFNISQRSNMPPLMTPYSKFNEFFNMKTPDFLIPCWSLATLFNYLREIDFFPDIEANEHNVKMSITYYDSEEGTILNPVHTIVVNKENFIDACYEMIIKLKEQKLL